MAGTRPGEVRSGGKMPAGAEPTTEAPSGSRRGGPRAAGVEPGAAHRPPWGADSASARGGETLPPLNGPRTKPAMNTKPAVATPGYQRQHGEAPQCPKHQRLARPYPGRRSGIAWWC